MIVTELGFLRLDPEGGPLFQQFYAGLRRAILGGQLPRGARLPASRSLAAQFRVSRTTVIAAYEQLEAEGYLSSRVGSGTYVTMDLPEESQLVHLSFEGHREASAGRGTAGPRGSASRYPAPRSAKATDRGRPAERGRRTEGANPPERARAAEGTEHAVPRPPSQQVRAFEPGVPALEEFPLRIWAQLQRRQLRAVTPAHLSYGPPEGHAPLREAVAAHLQAHRGVRCDPEQVMLVSGTQQAIDIILRLLVEPGDAVCFEDPGYPRARRACLAAGARLLPLLVDAHGARPPETNGPPGRARLAYVTPSHQYPLGVTLSLERRMQLIEWARRTNAWILEDDYDSEYRYGQRPIPALQGLDPSARTFYVGSFSKVLFPSLSMGYAVVPEEFQEAFARLLSLVSRPPSRLDQLVLHSFIEEGHFSRHLRRMRSTYRERRRTLVDALERSLAGALEILGNDAGLHVAVRLRGRKSDRTVSAELLARGIVAPPLRDYYMEEGSSAAAEGSRDGVEGAPRVKGLVLGYGCVPPPRILRAVRTMAEVIGGSR